MITAERLRTLTTFSPKALGHVLADSGYTGASFKRATFVGITNGGQFCYNVLFPDESGTGKDQVGKVFLTYDHAKDTVTADY
jgi:hypothetical protein